MVGQPRHHAGLPVARGTEVQGHGAARELGHQGRIIDGRRAVGDARGIQRQGPADLGRSAPLAGMHRDAEAAGTGDGERPSVRQRVGVGRFGTRQVEAHDALARGRDGRPGHGLVPRRAVGAHGHGDEPHLEAATGRADVGHAAAGAGRHRGDDLGEGQALDGVECRSPAHLGVDRAVAGNVHDELGRCPLQGLRVLEDRQRQIERGQEFGLVAARHRRTEALTHGLRRDTGGYHAARQPELEGRLRPQRAVQVQVELDLRQPRDQIVDRGRQGHGQRW